MVHHTKGVVLKTTNNSDSSLIAHIFTERFGMQSYLVPGAKRPKSKLGVQLFQPLHLLDMQVYHKESNQLQRIKEARLDSPFQNIPFDIVKSCLCMFIAEILNKSLRHQATDPPLFHFVYDQIILLDKWEGPLANFHLMFLTKLLPYLGFAPEAVNTRANFFDMMEGLFVSHQPFHVHFIAASEATSFYQLLQLNVEDGLNLDIHKTNRKNLIRKVIEYYKIHIDGFGELRSLEILEEVFS